MTRDDLLKTVSKFYKAETTAVVGFWNINIATVPPREITFSERFVDENIDKEGITTEELSSYLASTDGKWQEEKNGSLIFYVN